MADFESETRALVEAVHSRPVTPSDVMENVTYVKGETGSANHKLGANPAWWLDCQRRGDNATVAKGLDWCEWYANTAPLYENESMTCNGAYRVRMDQGTYALAMFAHFAGNVPLRDALLRKGRLSVGLCLLGAFSGPARRCVNENPQPPDVATLITCDGQLDPLEGSGGQVPHIACAGMRSKVREGNDHSGKITGLNDHHLDMLVAQALSLPYKKPNGSTQVDIFDTIRSRTGMLPWGLSPTDVQTGRDFLDDKSNLNLAATVHAWLLDAPLPKLPYAIIQHDSGAVEFVQLLSQNSSTGARQCEVVAANGTRYIGSADNGKRGGAGGGNQNIQPQEAVEHLDFWECRWLSGQGEIVNVPRPAMNDTTLWRVNIKDGNAIFKTGSGTTPPGPNPEPPDPGPQPPMQGAPLVYLGHTSIPGEYLYGSHDPNLTIREIHGDPASGYPKRWIAE